MVDVVDVIDVLDGHLMLFAQVVGKKKNRTKFSSSINLKMLKEYHMIMMNVILPLTMKNIQASYLMLFIVFYLLHMNIFETRARVRVSKIGRGLAWTDLWTAQWKLPQCEGAPEEKEKH